MTRNQKLWLFAALLICLLTLTILFGSGVLRFGLSGPVVYVLYIVAGMLAALLTFGMLTSDGQLNAAKGGARLRLGGSIVALVVVSGGGGVYERYLHQPEAFDLLVVYWKDDPNASANLKGDVTIYAGNNNYSLPLDGSGHNRFLGLPASLLGTALHLSLNSPGYQVVDLKPNVFTRDEPVKVQVRRAQIFAVPSADQLSVELDKAQIVDYAPRPDQRIVTLTLKFRLTAGLPVPLAKTARLQVFTETGSPLWDAKLQVDRPYVIAELGLSSESFEATIDRTKLEMLAGGRLAKITVAYEPSLKPPQPIEYSTSLFPIDTSTFDDLSKPAAH